jgi:hypothetical protein
MSLDTAGWGAAEPSDDVLTQVRDVLAADPSKAYRVRDFFRDAAPSAPGGLRSAQPAAHRG